MPCDKGNVVHAERQAIPGRALEPFAIFKRLGRKAVPVFPFWKKIFLAGKTPGAGRNNFCGIGLSRHFSQNQGQWLQSAFDIHFIFGELAHQPAISGFFQIIPLQHSIFRNVMSGPHTLNLVKVAR